MNVKELAKRSKRKLRKPPRQRFPLSIENEYSKELRAYALTLVNITKNLLLPELRALTDEAYQDFPVAARQDAWVDRFGRIIADIGLSLSRSYTERELQDLAERYGERTSQFQRKALSDQLQRVVGVDVYLTEPWLREIVKGFTERNVKLITTIEDRHLNRVQNIVQEGIGAGKRWEVIAEDLNAKFDIAETDADRIARDQIQKYNSQLNMLRQTELGIDSYIWRTAGDERVRDTHRAHEGNEYKWNDPPANTGHPGEDINCRCIAEPVLSDSA